MPAERIIYSIDQSNKLSFKNLFDLTFLNTLVIGSMTLFIGIVLKYIIPIYFEEFNGSIQFFFFNCSTFSYDQLSKFNTLLFEWI